MTRRPYLLDPLAAPLDQRARRLGAQDPREVGRRQNKGERFRDSAVLQARAIGFRAPTAGANQTVTATDYTLITGTNFRMSFAGPNDASWIVSVRYRIVVESMAAIDQDVFARIAVDWHDEGIWDMRPEIDLSTDHGFCTAFSAFDYAECAVTGTAFTLQPSLTAHVRGGDTIGIAVGVLVGSGHSADISLVSSARTPVCDGFALPYMVP